MVEVKVTKIENGTVVDHIPAGKAIDVLKLLGLKGNTTLIAMNVSSTKLGKKDILKVENKFLSPDEIKKIATIAPKATINTIKGSKVAEKKRLGA